MPLVKFPDGSEREFVDGVSLFEVAASISKSLAKNAVAARMDGDLRDLSVEVDRNCTVQIITKQEEASSCLVII